MQQIAEFYATDCINCAFSLFFEVSERLMFLKILSDPPFQAPDLGQVLQPAIEGISRVIGFLEIAQDLCSVVRPHWDPLIPGACAGSLKIFLDHGSQNFIYVPVSFQQVCFLKIALFIPDYIPDMQEINAMGKHPCHFW